MARMYDDDEVERLMKQGISIPRGEPPMMTMQDPEVARIMGDSGTVNGRPRSWADGVMQTRRDNAASRGEFNARAGARPMGGGSMASFMDPDAVMQRAGGGFIDSVLQTNKIKALAGVGSRASQNRTLDRMDADAAMGFEREQSGLDRAAALDESRIRFESGPVAVERERNAGMPAVEFSPSGLSYFDKRSGTVSPAPRAQSADEQRALQRQEMMQRDIDEGIAAKDDGLVMHPNGQFWRRRGDFTESGAPNWNRMSQGNGMSGMFGEGGAPPPPEGGSSTEATADADLPVLTPEEARKAKPGTRFKTQSGQIRVR